jgi:hypothetical protein
MTDPFSGVPISAKRQNLKRFCKAPFFRVHYVAIVPSKTNWETIGTY